MAWEGWAPSRNSHFETKQKKKPPEIRQFLAKTGANGFFHNIFFGTENKTAILLDHFFLVGHNWSICFSPFFLGYGIDFEDIQQHMVPDVLVRKVDIFNQQWLTIWAGNHIDQIRGSR